MTRKTRSPKTYQTSTAILALPFDAQYELVMGSAGNAALTFTQEDGSDVEITPTDLGLLIVGWDHKHNGYEIIDRYTHTPVRS